MKFKEIDESRRGFLKGSLAAAAIAGPEAMLAGYTPFKPDSLQVWSCGGLSEAFNELNAVYESKTGHNIPVHRRFCGGAREVAASLAGQDGGFRRPRFRALSKTTQGWP